MLLMTAFGFTAAAEPPLDSTETLAARLALLDSARHNESDFQEIIDTLGTYTSAEETEIVAMITVAFSKLRKGADDLSIYEVASGIKDVTEVVLAAARRHGISEREDLAYMTAIYIVIKQRECDRGFASATSSI